MAMPLSCIDRPHVRPSGGGYLWEATYRPADDYQRTRIFYGCYDWHSAANSMWSLVKSLKLFPKKATAGLIRSRLDKHFQQSDESCGRGAAGVGPAQRRRYGSCRQSMRRRV